jgi:hypothetical protein
MRDIKDLQRQVGVSKNAVGKNVSPIEPILEQEWYQEPILPQLHLHRYNNGVAIGFKIRINFFYITMHYAMYVHARCVVSFSDEGIRTYVPMYVPMYVHLYVSRYHRIGQKISKAYSSCGIL